MSAVPVLLAAYLAKRDALERFLRARMGSRQDAQDLMQELYLRIERPLVDAAIDDPAAYLFRMALNLSRDLRRARMRASARDAEWTASQTATLGAETVADAPSAEAGLAAKQRLAILHRAIETLPSQCRQAFVLHKLEGLSHRDVAQRLNISQSAVEKHMHRAIKLLLSRMETE